MEVSKEIKHVAIYLRISREKSDKQSDSLSNHRQRLQEFVKQKGYTYEEFGEVVSGGGSALEKRPKLQELLENIERFDAILCVEISRLARNNLISQTVKQLCIDYAIPIITPEKVYDLNSSNDSLLYDVGSAVSSHEHSIIGKRVKMNKMQMAKQGLHVSGSAPFGYKRNSKTKKLEIDEEPAKTIRYVFDLHSMGYGSFKIRDILNAEGYKSSRGGHFSVPSINRIIKNPAYKGWSVFSDRKKVKRDGKFKYEIVDQIIVKDAHPAIIEPNKWNIANRTRERRAEQSFITREKPNAKSETVLLKDLLYCGNCGRKMTIRKDRKESTGYTIKKCEYILPNGEKCSNIGIKLAEVQKNFMTRLMQYQEIINKTLSDLDSSDISSIEIAKKDRLSRLENQLDEINKKQKNLIDLALEGLFTRDELKDKKQELEDKKQKLTAQYNSALLDMNSESVEDTKEKLEHIKKVIENLPKMNEEEGNMALKTVIKQIKYYRVLPPGLIKKSTRNPERRSYPFRIEIEYFD
ncbi:recombinase family protein [Priestia megaterium]